MKDAVDEEVFVKSGGQQRGLCKPLLWRVSEAAQSLGISRSKAYELVASGTWPSLHIGKSVRIPLEGLERWIADQQKGGEA